MCMWLLVDRKVRTNPLTLIVVLLFVYLSISYYLIVHLFSLSSIPVLNRSRKDGSEFLKDFYASTINFETDAWQDNLSLPLINNINSIPLLSVDFIEYKYKYIPLVDPHLLTEHKHFFEHELNVSKIKEVWSDPMRWIGNLKVTHNAYFTGTFRNAGCGYLTKLNEISTVEKTESTSSVCPMFIPDGWSFQHFIQDTLPKLVQAYDILRDNQTLLLMQKPRPADINIIEDILKSMHLLQNVQYRDSAVEAKYLLNACITPPLHPVLFQGARNLIGGYSTLQVPRNEAYVVWLSRIDCHNCGRDIINKGEFESELERRYGKDRVIVHSPIASVKPLIQVFSRTKLIIGVHGGGIYNMLFATTQTKFVEIMPTPTHRILAGNRVVGWCLAQSFGMDYWKFYANSVDDKDNVQVNMTQMIQILNQID